MAACKLVFKSRNLCAWGKALAGLNIRYGLMLVILAGGELFTGKYADYDSVLDRKIKISSMFKKLVFLSI